MSNILLFLIHFAIISHFKSGTGIYNEISHKKGRNPMCFLVNRNLYSNTSASDMRSKKTIKTKLNDLKEDKITKEIGKDTRILLESPPTPLKSIIDNGSIKNSSIRHEILDKESLLDELIDCKENIKSILEDTNKREGELGGTGKNAPNKFDESFKELESSVLKRTVDKREQVIKPSDRSLRRQSKETIYTRLQNYVKSTEPMLSKHNILEEVKNFVHLLHWNVWHRSTDEGVAQCNWTRDQNERFEKLIQKIDRIIKIELDSFVEATSKTDQDLLNGIIEERSNLINSQKYLYNKMKQIVDLGDFEIYKDRMVNLYYIKNNLWGAIKRAISYLNADPREWTVYQETRRKYYKLRSDLVSLKYKLLSKLKSLKIFRVKANSVSENGRERREHFHDLSPKLDKINVRCLLENLSHTYHLQRKVNTMEEIKRKDLYNVIDDGKWTLYFVGSGSKQPTSTRLTSTMALRRGYKPGNIWLFDCGEGTKNGLENMNLDPLQVDRVFLTHLHGDHCYGIFSFLYLRERLNPLEIYGPPGLRKLINSIHQNTSTSTINHFVIHELLPRGGKQDKELGKKSEVNEAGDISINQEDYYNVYEDENVEVLAADLEHTMPTVGYVIQKKPSIWQRNKIKEMENLSEFETSFFKSGSLQNLRNKVTKKIVICQDTGDSTKMKNISQDADILVHEATLSPTMTLVSGVILDILRDDNGVTLSKGTLKNLNNMLSNLETKLGCFNFTMSALSSFVKCERYYLLQKLNIFKNFISTFKAPNREENETQERVKHFNKRDAEKELKEKWSKRIFIFMDRLKGIQELSKYEYFTNRLINRYNLMEKLTKVIPKLDLNKMINDASRSFVLSNILKDHNNINEAYIKFNIPEMYSRNQMYKVQNHLKEVSREVFDYWKEILQVELPEEMATREQDSNLPNWKVLYNTIIRSFGHSTPNMAGKFASQINAKKLILTHFSSRYAGDEKFENLLTMIRIENEARLGFPACYKGRVPVIAAWDKMKIRL